MRVLERTLNVPFYIERKNLHEARQVDLLKFAAEPGALPPQAD